MKRRHIKWDYEVTLTHCLREVKICEDEVSLRSKSCDDVVFSRWSDICEKCAKKSGNVNEIKF